MSYNKFLVIGGDLRSLYLYNLLNTNGNKVKLSGFSAYCDESNPIQSNISSLNKAVLNTEVVIGPIPCCSNGTFLNAPFNKSNIEINELFDVMKPNQIFFAGRITDEVLELSKEKHIRVFDILDQEEMAILNAIPTAEGAIQLALENMKITLHNSNVLVLGYGRIGKILSKMLQGIGANTFVAARKYSDEATIRSYGYQFINYKNLTDNLYKMDLIINTVPSILLDKSNLKYIKEDCLLIDLASKPFGIDKEESKKEGLNVMWAPSLPGKVAPITAASYIKDAIYNILEKLVE